MADAQDDLTAYTLEDLNELIARTEEAAIVAAMRGQGREASETLGELYALRDEVWERYRMQEWDRQRQSEWEKQREREWRVEVEEKGGSDDE